MTIKKRTSFLFLLDSLIVMFSIYVGYFILHPYINVFTHKMLHISSISILISHHFFSLRYGLYRKVWSYASVGELKSIVRAVTFSVLAVVFIQYLLTQDIYWRVLTITWMMHIILIGGSRFSWRVFADSRFQQIRKDDRGAGQAETMVTRQLLRNQNTYLKPI